jgi:hypothetical protein
MSMKLLAVIAVIVANLALFVKGDSIRLSDTASADGWSHNCMYYKAISVYKLEMPVAHKCDFIRNGDSGQSN